MQDKIRLFFVFSDCAFRRGVFYIIISSLISLSCVSFFSSKAWYGEYQQLLHSNSEFHKIWYRFRACSYFSKNLFCIVACVFYKLNTIVTNIFRKFFSSWYQVSCFWYTLAVIKHKFPAVFTFQRNSIFQYYVWHDDLVVFARVLIQLISNSAFHFLLAWNCKTWNLFSLNAFSISMSASAITASSSFILFSFASTVRFVKSVSIKTKCLLIKQQIFLFDRIWSIFKQSSIQSILWTLFCHHTFVESFFCVKQIFCSSYRILKR